MSATVEVERVGNVFSVYLNRPQVHNALTSSMIAELSATFNRLASEQECRVIVLAGHGRSFCSGADLREVQLITDQTGMLEYLRLVVSLVETIEQVDRPVIAAVHGYALAGGLELLAACDLALAADDAVIGDAHLPQGFMAAAGTYGRLQRMVGTRRARELVFTGRRLSGSEAAAIGLVNAAVPVDRLFEEAAALAERIAGFGVLAGRITKLTIAQAGGVQPGEARLELFGALVLSAGSEMRAGLAAHSQPASEGERRG